MSAQDNIYNRLKAAPAFHPGSVELFDDITLEPGDIVTIRSGQTDQSLPIYNQHITWTGSPMVTLESTGNEKRSALPPLQKKQKNSSFGGGRSAYMQEQKLSGYYQHMIESDGVLGMTAGVLGVVLDEDGNPVIDPTTGKFVYDDSSSAEIFGRLLVTANRTSLINAINQNGVQISGASLDLDASGNAIITAINDSRTGTATIKGDRIKLSSTTGSCIEIENDGTIKISAANVIDQINNNAKSSHIDAGKIYLNGSVIADSIDSVEAKIDNITSNTVLANTQVRSAIGQFTTAYLGTPYARVGSGDSASYIDLRNAFTGASGFTENVSTGKLEAVLTRANNEQVTLNFKIADTTSYKNGVSAAQKAVTINVGKWVYDANEADLQYTVTTDYGQSLGISPPALEMVWDGSWTSNSSIVHAWLKDSNGTRRLDHTQTISFSLQDKTITPSTTEQTVSCDDGYQGLGTITVNAYPVAVISTIGQYQTATFDSDQEEYNVFVRASGSHVTTKDTTLKVSASAAISYGIRQGELQFTPATYVTVQGAATSVTKQGAATSFMKQGATTSFTRQGSPVLITPIGSAATTVTVQGASTTVYTRGTGYYFYRLRYEKLYSYDDERETYVSEGTHYWYYRNSSINAGTYYSSSSAVYHLAGSTVTFYNAGSPVTYYRAGTPTTYYTQGSEVTAYYAGGASATYYAKGSNVTFYEGGSVVTYYKKS